MQIVRTLLEHTVEHHYVEVDIGDNNIISFKVVKDRGMVTSFLYNNREQWIKLSYAKRTEIIEMLRTHKYN